MEIIIDAQNANQRFDRFLRKYCKQYPDVSLTEIYKWIRKWFIKVNGKKAKENMMIQNGDIVLIKDIFELWKHNPEAAKSNKQKQKEHINRSKIKSRIIDETDDRLVRNKPAGIVIHESQQHYKDLSMHDYLDAYLEHIHHITTQEKSDGETFKPSFGYRLDKDTSGILIAAKTYNALQYINKIIRDRQIDKRYVVLVAGTFPATFQNTKALEKGYDEKFGRAQVKIAHNGKASRTDARCIKSRQHKELGAISLVKVKIQTGRMHQIRVHLADGGYPVLWDLVYGNPVVNRKLSKQCKIHRQLLHCRKYSFNDDINKVARSRQAPLPEEFVQMWSPMI